MYVCVSVQVCRIAAHASHHRPDVHMSSWPQQQHSEQRALALDLPTTGRPDRATATMKVRSHLSTTRSRHGQACRTVVAHVLPDLASIRKRSRRTIAHVSPEVAPAQWTRRGARTLIRHIPPYVGSVAQQPIHHLRLDRWLLISTGTTRRRGSRRCCPALRTSRGTGALDACCRLWLATLHRTHLRARRPA